uniref:KOW domain-containing protein n=1 Tax=Pyramimonas obovata TaxID=1411642 RepID=A0A6T7UTI9_9CHLO|mmetsp:Transcript_15989/g.34718  ORF Transcript_15989/g.34718 Transcript_15989/m.34718 type:complete len:228 (+) Transcript_15989:398-1081(+)
MGVQSKARLARSLFPRWKIFRGDDVMINWGRDKGQTGKVVKVFRKKNRVIVEGRNLVKKTIKRTEQQPGGIITKEAPIHVTNVQVLDPATGSPVRIGWKYLEDGTKVRVGRGHLASGSVIPRPEILKERRKPLPTSESELTKTTPLEVVWKKSFGESEGQRLLGEALKNLSLEESLRPKDQPPKKFIPGHNALPSSLSKETCEQFMELAGLLRSPLIKRDKSADTLS